MPDTEGHGSPRKGSLRGRDAVAVGVLVLVCVAALLLFAAPPFDTPREQARHHQCRHHLKVITLALRLYHDDHGSYPPAVVKGPDGEPWHSWRVLLLPYLEEDAVFAAYRFDERWGSSHNCRVAETLSSSSPYFCYADEEARRVRTTSYVAVVGEGTMWPPDGSAIGLADVRDDPAGTAHVVEMAESGIFWSEPRDLDFGAMTFEVNSGPGRGVRAVHPGEELWFRRRGPKRANAGFVDGVARPLEEGTQPDRLRSMLLKADGAPAAD